MGLLGAAWVYAADNEHILPVVLGRMQITLIVALCTFIFFYTPAIPTWASSPFTGQSASWVSRIASRRVQLVLAADIWCGHFGHGCVFLVYAR